MIKILAACGAGIGTSMLIQKKIAAVCASLGLEAEVTHGSIGNSKSKMNKYDVIFTMAALAENLNDPSIKTPIIGLRNALSEQEIEAGVRSALKLEA